MSASMILIAAALVVCVGVAHSWLGEMKLIGPLTAPENRCGLLAKSPHARHVLRFAWHITSLAWLGLAGVLVLMTRQPLDGAGRGVVAVIAGTFLSQELSVHAAAGGTGPGQYFC